MKTILFAAIAVLALTANAPAFADKAHGDAAAAARGTWRTNESDGVGAKQYQAAIDPHDLGGVAPHVALSDTVALA